MTWVILSVCLITTSQSSLHVCRLFLGQNATTTSTIFSPILCCGLGSKVNKATLCMAKTIMVLFWEHWQLELTYYNLVFSAEEILIRMKGELVTTRYLERQGFNYPIAVTEMEGLGLKLPPSTFSVKDVEQYVGKKTWLCCHMYVCNLQQNISVYCLGRMWLLWLDYTASLEAA